MWYIGTSREGQHWLECDWYSVDGDAREAREYFDMELRAAQNPDGEVWWYKAVTSLVYISDDRIGDYLVVPTWRSGDCNVDAAVQDGAATLVDIVFTRGVDARAWQLAQTGQNPLMLGGGSIS